MTGNDRKCFKKTILMLLNYLYAFDNKSPYMPTTLVPKMPLFRICLCSKTALVPHCLFRFIACSEAALVQKLPLYFHPLYHVACTTFLLPHPLFRFIACSKTALVPKLPLYFHCLYHIACTTFLLPHSLFRFIVCS